MSYAISGVKSLNIYVTKNCILYVEYQVWFKYLYSRLWLYYYM